EEVQLLMDEGDLGARRVGRMARGIDRAGEAHRAFVRPHDPADDIHQRALAGPVLADQAEDAALRQSEADVAHGVDAGEGLGHAGELEDRLAHAAPSRARSRVRATSSVAATRMIPPFTTSM